MTPEEIVQAVVGQSRSMTRPVYRGQADADWQPESGAVRRLRQAYGEDFPVDETDLRNLVAEYHKEQLITPMQVIDGTSLSDLQRLSVLQNQGAATGLLDFTEYLLVALWFACTELPDKDAKIFVLDIGNPQIARNTDTTSGLRRRLQGRFEPTPDGKGLFGYTRNPDTYVEVIPYEKLLLDAQARNAIFFDKLGLGG